MKLIIVTVVEEYHKDILQLFKAAKINNFSESDIDGYKNSPELLVTESWFPMHKGATDSRMFFSFTEDDKIEEAFTLIKEFNKNIVTLNPIRAIVVPIEKYI